MSDSFNPDEFLDWLDEQDGPVTKAEMEQWKNFPWANLHGVTGPIVDGELAYYQRDLERAADGYRPID